jgi:hypothetical protein
MGFKQLREDSSDYDDGGGDDDDEDNENKYHSLFCIWHGVVYHCSQ